MGMNSCCCGQRGWRGRFLGERLVGMGKVAEWTALEGSHTAFRMTMVFRLKVQRNELHRRNGWGEGSGCRPRCWPTVSLEKMGETVGEKFRL